MSLAAAEWSSERAAEGDSRKVHVIQGEFHVSDEPDLMLTTILGSCVAACVRDPVTGVGGMNHFLLPGEEGGEGLRYGVQSMELLVNALLRRGARRDRLEVKLFGGARLIDGLTDVGSQNAAFAERFVQTIKLEVLDHFVCFGVDHLRYIVKRYESFYNRLRPHQGLNNRTLPVAAGDEPETIPLMVTGSGMLPMSKAPLSSRTTLSCRPDYRPACRNQHGGERLRDRRRPRTPKHRADAG